MSEINSDVIIASPSVAAIMPALVKAQAGFTAPKRNREGQAGSRRYDYADLQSVLDAVLPPLNENGIALIQPIVGNVLRTVLVHESGEWIAAEYRLPEHCKDAQALGSEITYGRRYSVSALCGVASEDDDDGAGAGKRQPQPIQKEAAVAVAELVWHGSGNIVLEWAKVIGIEGEGAIKRRLVKYVRELDGANLSGDLTEIVCESMANEIAIAKAQEAEAREG